MMCLCFGEQVSAGYATTEYGCLEFITKSSESHDGNLGLIIGLCVGFGLLLLIIIIIVIIICVLRSRRGRKDTDDATMTYNNVRNDQIQGTTRSFMFGSEHLSDKPEESVNVSQY